VRAPLERLARDRFWRTFVELLALNVGISLALLVAGRDLRTDAAPNGLLTLQFAGDVEDVGRILRSWSPRARAVAAFGLGLDYLYMPIYAAGASFLGAKLALAARHRGRTGLAGWVAAVAWLPWLAAAADATENAAALELVLGGPQRPVAHGGPQRRTHEVRPPGLRGAHLARRHRAGPSAQARDLDQDIVIETRCSDFESLSSQQVAGPRAESGIVRGSRRSRRTA